MVTFQKILEDGNLIEALTLNFKGDQCVLKTEFVVLGLSSIISYKVVGVTPSLKIEFRATVDSVNWTDWDLLSLEALQSLKIDKKHPFQIEYKVTCTETMYNSLISIELELEYESQLEPSSYSQTCMSDYMPFLNTDSLLWAVNVLEKFYKKGIVPEFIERSTNIDWKDRDYLDFWWTLIYANALKVSYNKVYKETLYRKDLLKDYLTQRGLVCGFSDDLGELYYLASYYFNELRRRGTWSIFEETYLLPQNFKDIKVKGELLRLLNSTSKKIDSFILMGSEVGWFVGNYCPTYPSGTSSTSIIKGYELEQSVSSLSSYPLVNSQYIQKTNSSLNDGTVGSGITINPPLNEVSGIGCGNRTWEELEKYSISVNPRFSYEITFLIKKGYGENLEVGVDCFNSYGDSVGLLSSIKNIELETDLFFKKDLEISDSIEKLSFVRCIIWSIDYEQFDSKTSFGDGTNLRFRKMNTSSIVPRILVTGAGGSGVFIYDFKVRPCLINNSEFLSQENLLFLRGDSNNKEYSEQRVKEYIDDKLIPYNMELVFNTKEI